MAARETLQKSPNHHKGKERKGRLYKCLANRMLTSDAGKSTIVDRHKVKVKKVHLISGMFRSDRDKRNVKKIFHCPEKTKTDRFQSV